MSTFPSSLDVAIGTIDPMVTYLFAGYEKKSIRDFPSAHRIGVRDPTLSASNFTQSQGNGCANRWQNRMSSNLAHPAQSQQNSSDLALDLKVDYTIT